MGEVVCSLRVRSMGVVPAAQLGWAANNAVANWPKATALRSAAEHHHGLSRAMRRGRYFPPTTPL
jgi:hypothetical protein